MIGILGIICRNINNLFFWGGNSCSDLKRDSFDNYYMPLVEIKDFNALLDNELLFDQPVNNKQEPYGKHVEMSRNDAYARGNLLQENGTF